MKFRKVAAGPSNNNPDAAGQWSKSGKGGDDDVKSAPTGGRAVARTKSHRRLPIKINGANNNKDYFVEEATISSPPKQEDSKAINEFTQSQSQSNDTTSIGLLEKGEEVENEMEMEENKEIEQDHKDAEETVPPVTPKAKDIQYTVEERYAPPREVLAHFYHHAMQCGQEESINGSNNNVDDNDETKIDNDNKSKVPNAQLELSQARLLSLEDVLLPAIAFQENQALRDIQRKIQRDAPDQTHIVKAGRIAVNKCLAASILAAKQSRLERRVLEEKREENQAQERQVKIQEKRQERAKELERRRVEHAKAKATQQMKEKKELKKKFPTNQELWREVAYLMTEHSKLERESRLWQEAEASFDAREESLKRREEAVKLSCQERANSISENKDSENETKESAHFVDMKPFDQSMDDIVQSSNNIKSALKLVTELMVDSEQLRKNLYRRYRHDHQFEGYRGVDDPKGLIRILSQDTEA